MPAHFVFESDIVARDRRAELETAVVAARRSIPDQYEGAGSSRHRTGARSRSSVTLKMLIETRGGSRNP
jgi:hypothetical protein